MNKLVHIIAHTLIALIAALVFILNSSWFIVGESIPVRLYPVVGIAGVIALIDFFLLLAVIGFSPEENPTLFKISTYYLFSLSCAGLIFLVIYINFIL